uniref:Mobile element protein n=1 Tax=Klebsiella pneumoniae TaxID=573 RepID=A0A6G9I0L2_KLEPN|nr:Mobile element protein [Klebsiella pneumoniae]
MHLAVDSKTHEIICADLSLNNVTDSEAFPGLIRQTHRKIRAASADGAYDPRLCHDELRRKKISALIPPRKGAGYWPGDYADRNRAVANQRMTGSNARWKWTTDYNRRSRPQRYSDLAITTVLVIKRVFRLTLRAAQGFIDSIFSLMNVPLRCPDYSCVSRRAKSVNISFKTPTRGEIAHITSHVYSSLKMSKGILHHPFLSNLE